MELEKIKTELYKIIDDLKDEKLLSGILRLLKNEHLVDSDWAVSDSPKRELDKAYDESFDGKNLLDWEIVKQRLNKLLYLEKQLFYNHKMPLKLIFLYS